MCAVPGQGWRRGEDAEGRPKYVLAASVVVGARDQGQQHELFLGGVLAALSHGMAELGKLQLQLSNLHQHKEQLALLRRLWDGLADGWGVALLHTDECGLPEAQAERVMIQRSVLMA